MFNFFKWFLGSIYFYKTLFKPFIIYSPMFNFFKWFLGSIKWSKLKENEYSNRIADIL